MWVSVAVVGAALVVPAPPPRRRRRGGKSEGGTGASRHVAESPLLMAQLQDFAWTEGELSRRKEERDTAAGGRTRNEPMFCFETAAKLFFWSCLTYEDFGDHDRFAADAPENGQQQPKPPEPRGSRSASASATAAGGGGAGVAEDGAAPGAPAAAAAAASLAETVLEQLAKGMALYGLTVHKIVYDPVSHVKALFSWSNDTVVVSFRRTGSPLTTAAVMTCFDQFWRVAVTAQGAHEAVQTAAGWWRPWLRRQPKVHSGFMRCWRSRSGLDRRVMAMLSSLVDNSLAPERLTIYLTGHSLGGSLATLCGYELLKKYGGEGGRLRRDQVKVYGFGAPRTGNHAFAQDYGRTVPDTWHVINDQDVVPRGGKFLTLYKRNGHRVIVNRAAVRVH
ncbi:hypothetical protein MNEG_11444 [Monoraphidium neglectum]|uniref:Fungal lipase-type domain-containing protein n=1 Tax=Monoraphidium neglectum TaxID=145388 RepID=A0A0D2KL79_9CHLO|nr:hypothetical protein MNEG_11444 [Monoraphidium neglectum]KIY96518.1 hypothetical protein MNEG_11444 [Monoraphidium neglectum]|eukprot:XP_013895538.1 hypothetical protein MNEG_11444 [Monoraphidium neglectum]